MANRDNERIAVERKRSGSSPWLWIIGALVLGAILLLLLIPLFNNNDSAGPDTGATISEIVQAPNTYVGNTVTVSGAVNEMIGPRAFTIGGDEFYGDAQLLVVSANELPVPQGRTAEEALLARDVIQVTGPVRLFDLATFEDEIGADLDDAAFEPYAGQPAVIARSVDLTPYLGAAPTAPGDAAPAGTMGPFTEVTVADIAGDPAAYVGQNVAVTGGVEEVISPAAFTIDEDAALAGGIDNDLLVVSALLNLPTTFFTAEALENNRVLVAGPVRMFDLVAFEEEYGVDLDDAAFEAHAGRPAIIAQAIQVAGPVAPAPGAAAPAPAAPAAEVANVTLDKLTENPAAFAGQMVVVDGGVNVVLNEQAFTIADNTLLDTNEVLVLNATGQAPARALRVEEPVIVLGTARLFNLAEVEQELGYDLQDDLFTDYEGKPVILARGVRVAAAPASAAPAPAGEAANVTVADIAGDLPRYAGQTVTVRQEVEEVISPLAFSLDEDGVFEGGIDDDLLVVHATEDAPLDFATLEGNPVAVSGTVRQFDIAAFEEELGYDLDDALFADWAGRPAIIATAVEPIPAAE